MADGETVAVAQPVWRLHAMVAAVEEGAVGGDVVQPVAAVFVADFGVLAGNEAGRIGQRPIEVGVAADIDVPPPGDRNAEGPAVGQAGLVFDLEIERHCRSRFRYRPRSKLQERVRGTAVNLLDTGSPKHRAPGPHLEDAGHEQRTFTDYLMVPILWRAKSAMINAMHECPGRRKVVTGTTTAASIPDPAKLSSRAGLPVSRSLCDGVQSNAHAAASVWA